MLFKILSICKGGGYRYCRTEPPHPRRNAKGLYPLHRVRMENKLGRRLRIREEVHHKDDNKKNDEGWNLEVIKKKEHAKYHQLKNAPKRITIKCKCGKDFVQKSHIVKLRLRRNKSKKLFCSGRCGSKYSKKS